MSNQISFSQLIADSLMKINKQELSDLSAKWNAWIASLRDYVNGVNGQNKVYPKSVVITNGEWWIVFENPRNAFLSSNTPNSEEIYVFENRGLPKIRKAIFFDNSGKFSFFAEK